jgi:PAS domain S-box-containing protein
MHRADTSVTQQEMRRMMRDLLALSALPAAWVGRQPREIPEGCLDVLAGVLQIELGFIRLRDADTGESIEAVYDPEGHSFAEWVRREQLEPNPVRHNRVVLFPTVGEPLRVAMVPIGMNGAAGLVALGCASGEFPRESDLLLASVAANHASTAFRTAILIRERARTSESLRQQEEMNRRILESGNDCVQVLALDGTLEYLSPQASRTLEIEDPRQLLGERWVEFWTGDGRARAEYALREAQRGGEGRFQGTCPTSKGNILWWDVVVTPIFGANGTIEKLLAVSRDITVLREAEKAIVTSELKFRSVVESVTDAFMAIGRDWTLNYVNENGARALKHTREELIGHNVWEVFPEAVGTPFDVQYRRALEENIPAHFEEYFAPLATWFEIHAYPSSDGLAVFFRDINDRKQAEADLREREEAFRVLANSIPNMAWMAKPDGHVFWYNQRWYDYTGSSEAEMQGWGWTSVHDAKTLDRVVARWKASLESGDPFEMEFPLRGADGSFRWFLTRIIPIRNFRGEIVRWFGTNTDVDEFRHMRDKLRSSQQHLSMALAASETGTFRWDFRKSKFLEFDSNLLAPFGLSPSDPADTFERVTRNLNADDRDLLRQAFERCAAGADLDMELRVEDGNDECRWVYTRGRALADDDGTPTYLIGICAEITSRKQAEEKLRRTEKLATAGRLAATVAHEINNPLAALTNLLYLAQSAADRNQLQSLLETADRELKRVAHIAQQTLGFYRDASAPVLTDIFNAASEVASLYQNQTAVKQISLGLLRRGETTAAVVPGEIRQVLANLISNAMDAVGSGGYVKVRVSEAVDFRSNGKGIRITVSDNGTGIPRQQVPRLFEPFFTTKKDVGTGLGLWVTQEIVGKHQGSIRVRSSVKGARRGTTFIVFIPDRTIDAAVLPFKPEGAGAREVIEVREDSSVVGEELAGMPSAD